MRKSIACGADAYQGYVLALIRPGLFGGRLGGESQQANG
jgi:hypothetical protein